MSGWLGDVWRRHRRKFFISGVVVAGCYAAGKLVQSQVTKWQQDLAQKYIHSQRKIYYEKNQVTCLSTYVSFEQMMKESIEETFDTVSLTELLRSKPPNRIEIWEELKIISFSKTASSVFSSCLVLVYIRVLMNIASGYMFVEKMEIERDQNSLNGSEMQNSMETLELHKHCTDFIKYATGEGLQLLMKDVKAIVKDLIGHIGLKEQLSFEDTKAILHNIWKSLRDNHDSSLSTYSSQPIGLYHPFVKYMISPELHKLVDNSATSSMDTSVPQVLLEALDVVESNDCFTTINSCIQIGLSFIGKELSPFFQREVNQDVESIVLIDQEPEMESITLHMAKVMPLISAQAKDIFKDAGDKNYLNAIGETQQLNNLAANIYESFSSTEKLSI